MNHNPSREFKALERLKAQIFSNCPLKTGDNEGCGRCQIKIEDSQKLLLCHCGRKLKVEILQSADRHWKTAIKTVSSLNSAINRQYADEETMKYISNNTLSEDQFQVTRAKILGEKLASESVEQAAKAGSPKLWDIIAEKAKRGLFDDHAVFKALVEAMSSKAERLSHGHSLAGIIYRPELDNWLITAGAYSSGVVSLFRDNFAGYQYSFANENPNPNWALLTKFPSDEEITCALKIARVEAYVLKEFVGNDVPHSPISSTTRIQHVNPALWTQEPKQFYDNISNSIDHDYQETKVPSLTVSEALSTAAEIHANDEAANSIVGQLSQRIEYELYSSFQLPNLRSYQTESTHPEITKHQPTQSPLITSSSTLNFKNLVKLRHEHNTPTIDGTTRVSDMKPSQCSKMLSMLYQENCVQVEPLCRHKRWNMTAKIRAADIICTVGSKIPVITTEWLKSGQLSELNPLKRHKWVIIIKDSTLYIGRILAIYENSNSKHSVVKTAASPSNLSFISVVMGRYQHSTVDVSWDPDSQNSYFYVHISPNRVAHIFQESKDEEFKFLQPGHHSISPKVQMILQSISISTWAVSFEKTLSALKAAGKDPLT
ncbi:uncharacterized protein MELLADRAFT_108348 [Melampsora larici-populina 98AG31]|uniref:Uncharacterized protein n=1 Tax=Melampsora larici-populina (strain 98AG31 / pathotype 3-4-7) TaxID=747676 RepID=F4RST9_MELLP|nr:uncharacterized protein MELLADRAFT_108348 [Melampsora larici-populina 98AG31]EGG04548.1 hypothetical protein MELLADRAFT_108348 [Melampsora larici-populina 98AG31]